MAININGETLTITLESGVTEIDVIDDLYEPWKDWMLTSPLNRKYPQAFVSDGGNPLSAIINQGSYIFLQNQLGWRIKHPEEDITAYLTGNLAVNTTTLPAFIPTIGAYTAAIIGLQPVTQGVTEEMGIQLEHTLFLNGVALDAVKGVAGTDGTIGSHATPVNNAVDAGIIASNRGVETIVIHGTYTLTAGDDLSGLVVAGENAVLSQLIIETSADVTECEFRNLTIYDSVLDGNNVLRFSFVKNLTYVEGYLSECMLAGNIQIASPTDTYFLDCKSGCVGIGADDLPKLDLSNGESHVAFRNWAGPLKIINSNNVDTTVCIDVVSGATIIFDSTVIAGEYTIRGSANVEHTQTGTENIIYHTTEVNTWRENKALTVSKWLGLK